MLFCLWVLYNSVPICKWSVDLTRSSAQLANEEVQRQRAAIEEAKIYHSHRVEEVIAGATARLDVEEERAAELLVLVRLDACVCARVRSCVIGACARAH